MTELESQSGESFYRCHRGYLVNMSCITEYSNDSIRLSNGEGFIWQRKDTMNLSKHICGICRMEEQRVFDVVNVVQEVLYALFQGKLCQR